MHLYPAVPTAENTLAFIAKFKSASSKITTALLPPNSKIVFPNLLLTFSETYLPIAQEPVKETKDILGSSTIKFPMVFPYPKIQVETLSGTPYFAKTSLKILV